MPPDTTGAVPTWPRVVEVQRLWPVAASGEYTLSDAATGRRRWEFAADGPVASSPAVSGDVVCVAAGLHSPGSLYGVDAATGHRRWKTAFSSGIASAALTASAGQLYLGVDGHLYALDARTGRRHWKFAMGAGDVNSASVPAVAGSVVYISGWGAVYAVSQKGKGGTARPSAGRQPG